MPTRPWAWRPSPGNLATGFQKFEGRQILDQFKGTAMQIVGYIDALDEASVEIVPTVYYTYNARPTLEGKAYQQMNQEIVAAHKAAIPLDADAIYPEAGA